MVFPKLKWITVYVPCTVVIEGKKMILPLSAMYIPRIQTIFISKNLPFWGKIYGIFHELLHHFINRLKTKYNIDNIDCIEEFIDRIDYCLWLKENMKSIKHYKGV